MFFHSFKEETSQALEQLPSTQSKAKQVEPTHAHTHISWPSLGALWTPCVREGARGPFTLVLTGPAPPSAAPIPLGPLA